MGLFGPKGSRWYTYIHDISKRLPRTPNQRRFRPRYGLQEYFVRILISFDGSEVSDPYEIANTACSQLY